MHFNGGGGGGRAVVVNGNAGVDAGVLRHQVTDFQQDVARIPAGEERVEEERGRSQICGKKEDDRWKSGATEEAKGTNRTDPMSMVKRALLVTGFWSGPFRVTEGLGRPHTLQQRTTVSPNAHTTSDRTTRNSGATARQDKSPNPSSLNGGKTSTSDGAEPSRVGLHLTADCGLSRPRRVLQHQHIPFLSPAAENGAVRRTKRV